MNAALYFELVDAVAKTDRASELRAIADRISTIPMHPLERRVLDRAVRARTEALAIQRQLVTDQPFPAPVESSPPMLRR